MTNSASITKAALYLRLSKDDDLSGDSSSIITQRQMLQKYAKDNKFLVVDEYVDDGYSGTNFNRPGFQRMISDIEDGKVNCVVVKDMSRFGRNYLEVGRYTEMYFPENGVRFIAINNGIDSANQQDSDFTPFLNIINEWYAKDTSKKIKAALKTKRASGACCCPTPPFGYIKDPNDPSKIVIDEETAPIIRYIFSLALKGYGGPKIAQILTAEKIPTPSWFYYSRYGTYGNLYRDSDRDKYFWYGELVRRLLRSEAYIGNMVYNKMPSISYKTKRRLRTDSSKWIRVENTHEPLISRDEFYRVQEMIKSRRVKTVNEEQQLFAGLLKCGGCGYAMKFVSRKSAKGFSRFLYCSYYAMHGKQSCSQHRINYDDLYGYVLLKLQHWSKLCEEDEKKLVSLIVRDNEKNSSVSFAEKELKKAQKRLSELDGLLAKLYEDRLAGIITDRNFDSLCLKFQTEQSELDKKVASLSAKINSTSNTLKDAKCWIEAVKKYSNPTTLTVEMLNALIEKIVVHEAEKLENGEKRQKVDIYYRFIGKID